MNWKWLFMFIYSPVVLFATPDESLSGSTKITTVPSPPYTHEGILASWTKGFYRVVAEY